MNLALVRTPAKNDMRVPGAGSAVLARGLMDVPLDDDGPGSYFGTEMTRDELGFALRSERTH